MPANLSAYCGAKFIEIMRALGVSAVALCGAMGLEGAEREAVPEALIFGKEQVLVAAKFFEIAPESPAVEAVLPWLKDAPDKVVKVFPAEQAAGLAAVLGATKGIDLLAAPSVTTRSGQEAVIEIVREVRYPIDWKKDAKTGGWEPSKYDTKKTGVTLGVLAKVQDAEVIDLTLRPEVVKLAGFHDLDELSDALLRPEIPTIPGLEPIPPSPPITPPPAATHPVPEGWLKQYDGDVVPAGRRARAHFAVRKIENAITVRPGESVLLELGAPHVPEAAKRRNFVLATVKIVPSQRVPAGVKIEAVDETVVAPNAEAKLKLMAPSGWKSAMMEKAEKVILPRVEFREATVREFVKILFRSMDGDPHPQMRGVNVVLKLPEPDTTVITLSSENISLAETLKDVADQAGLEIEAGEEAIVLRTPGPKVTAMREPAAGTPEAQLLARARGMVIPRMEFKDATVAEGVEFLRKKSAELDRDQKAVNIVVMPFKSGPGDLVTLDLGNVSLAGALGYVAQLAGLRLEVTGSAFVLRPDKE